MKVGKVACWLLVAVLLAPLAGCAQRKAVVGNRILVEKVRQIVPGVTKESQIEPLFGPPDLTKLGPDGSKDYLYKYSGYTYSGADLLIVSWRTRKPEKTELLIKVRKGIVVNVSYTDSAGRPATLSD